jgi:putative ABC transport system permease protein
VAGLILSVGQGLAQRDAVLANFQRPDLRTFTITDAEAAGLLPPVMIERTGSLAEVEQAWMLSSASDVRNSAFDAGNATPAAALTGDWERIPITLLKGRLPNAPGEAIVDNTSSAQLGLLDGLGAVSDTSGNEWAIVGVYLPGHANAPTGVLYQTDVQTPARSLHVTVEDVLTVGPISQAVVALSDATGPGQLRIEDANDVATIQQTVATSLSDHGRTIVLTTMAGGGLVLAMVSILMVNARRQEFGRRRALGATRAMVAALVALQGLMVIAPASILGGLGATLLTWIRESVLVPVDFTIWVILAASLGGIVAQLPSAIAAGYRDPVRVLRKP